MAWSRPASILILFLFAVGALSVVTVAASGKPSESTKFDGTIRDGQREIYSVNATSGDVFNVTLRWESNKNDLDLYLADPARFQVAKSNHVGTNVEFIQVTINETGRYLILVDSYDVISPEITYSLESNVPIYHFDTLYRFTLILSGLSSERPTNFTSTVLGFTIERQMYQSFIQFVDNGSTIELLGTVPISDEERLHTSDVTTWTVTSPTEATVVFYDQFRPRLTFDGLLTAFPTTIAVIADGRHLNFTSSTFWRDWADRGSFIIAARTVQAAHDHRFTAVGVNKWLVNSSFEASMQYYQQWRATLSVAGVPDSGSESVTFTRTGQPVTLYLPSGTWSDWVDDGSLLSLPTVSLGGTDTERWATQQKDFVVHDPGPFVVRYTHQYRVTVVASGLSSGPVPLASVTQFGDSRQVPVASEWSDWVDAGSQVALPNTLDDGKGTMWVASSGGTLTASRAGLFTISYTPRFRVSLVFATEEGAPLPSPIPSSVDLIRPNGTVVVLTRFDGVWLDYGGWQVRAVNWRGANIATGLATSFSPSPGGVWVVETQVRSVSLRVEDFARLPVAGADVRVSYPDGTSYQTTTDNEGYAELPAIYPGTTIIRVDHLGLTTTMVGDYSGFSGAPLLATVPLSTPTVGLLVAVLIAVVAALLFLALRRRHRQ